MKVINCKRLLLIFLTLCVVFTTIACSEQSANVNGNQNPSNPQPPVAKSLSVYYMDVGTSDCTLIVFPDGKTMLINLGSERADSVKKVKDVLKQAKVSVIDYLVIGDIEENYLGDTSILDQVTVKNAYLPDVRKTGFSAFDKIKQKLTDNGVNFQTSMVYQSIIGEDYGVAFLSPDPITNSDSPYREFNFSLSPTESQICNLSPTLYMEYAGKRFVFTCRANAKQENKIVAKYELGLYDKCLSDIGVTVNLGNVDFYKVARHGCSSSNGEKFLELLKPNNAIVSVGGDNYYGYPSSSTLINLEEVNEGYSLYRTDVKGDVCVKVDENSSVSISTQG